MTKEFYKEDAIISAYVTNLGMYNEGVLCGCWVSFPITEEEESEIMKTIKIGECDSVGCPYEEIFMTDYMINFDGLSWNDLGEYIQIERLNEIAEELESLSESDKNKVQAILESGFESDVLEAIESVDDYNVMENVNDEADLGYYWIEESGCYQVPEYLANYIDYEAFGRDCAWDGAFTSYGFVERC